MKVDSVAVALDRIEKKGMETYKKKEKNDVVVTSSLIFMFFFVLFLFKVLEVGNSQDFFSLQPPSLLWEVRVCVCEEPKNSTS